MGGGERAGPGRGGAIDEAGAGILRLQEALDAARPLRMRPDLVHRLLEALPCPAAAFARDGTVLAANRRLLRPAKRTKAEALSGQINLLNRVPDENYAVFEAVEGVFFGEACAVGGLVRPLSLFARGDGYPARDRYSGAVFCPVVGEDGGIAGGVVALRRSGEGVEGG